MKRNRALAWGLALAGMVAVPSAAAPPERTTTGHGNACLPGAAWSPVTRHAEWEGRAGLQAIDLGKDLFVMGGRGAFNPFQTTIYQDVWKSSDRGASWEKVSGPAEWPARAYFQAVRHRGRIVVLGGQNFDTLPNPGFPRTARRRRPPASRSSPPRSSSTTCGAARTARTGTPLTENAGWAGRAGLSAVVFRGEIYVFGGSQGDDASTGGQGRKLFNDVWKSRDGKHWAPVTAAAPWAPRAGAAAVVKDGYIYLLGGERGFTCRPPAASACVPERDLYFNDVWRTRNGKDWEQVTAAAGWSPRPGHQCVVALDQIVCFGGYGEPKNPNDIWASRDGKRWLELEKPASPPWRAVDPDAREVRLRRARRARRALRPRPVHLTFGGDRERFELPAEENAKRVDNDVWRLGWTWRPRH